VIIFKSLIYNNHKNLKNPELSIFKIIPPFFFNETNKESINTRKIIISAYNIIITTNNNKELEFIAEVITQILTVLGLNINEKRILSYNKNKKIKFNYLGYTFAYIPYFKIKPGGILNKKEYFAYKKDIKLEGLDLLYPSTEAFYVVKQFLKNNIDDLEQKSVKKVINSCNKILND
jgi:hypothetical protein